jgi:hypothetical protein
MLVVSLSEHVREVIEVERKVIADRLSALRAQEDRIRAVVAEIERDVGQTARLLRQMDEMLGRAPQLCLESLQGDLRGQRLREIAVELLRQKRGIGSVVHYREWYGILEEAGLRVAGKDPLATFLTQIARAPGVESVRPRSGLYRLRAA